MNNQTLRERFEKEFPHLCTIPNAMHDITTYWLKVIAERDAELVKEIKSKEKDNLENPQVIIGLNPDDEMWNGGYRTGLQDALNLINK